MMLSRPNSICVHDTAEQSHRLCESIPIELWLSVRFHHDLHWWIHGVKTLSLSTRRAQRNCSSWVHSLKPQRESPYGNAAIKFNLRVLSKWGLRNYYYIWERSEESAFHIISGLKYHGGKLWNLPPITNVLGMFEDVWGRLTPPLKCHQ